MKKKLINMLTKINAKKQEVKDLVAADKLDDAENAKKELIDMQKKFDLLYDLEEDEEKSKKEEIENKAEMKKEKTVDDAFINAIRAGFNKEPVAAEDKEILNAMTEGVAEDGGLTVPSDIQTSVKELRRSEDALENLVNVEYVTTNTGSRVIEKEADSTPFDNVDEAAEFGEESTPKFKKVDYKIKKKGGILKVTRELLQDANEKIIRYLKRWIAKKSKATRNALILKLIKDNAEKVLITNYDGLKDIINVELDPAIALDSIVITNQDGFNWMDKQKDEKGRYILQPDPTQPTRKLLFGAYPVKVLSNKTLKSNYPSTYGYAIPIIVGSLKEYITIFDREKMTIEISTEAGDLWKKDQTGIKVRERLDAQIVDEEAVVVGLIEVITDTNKDGKYTQEELEALTKNEILAISENLGYHLDETMKKAELITSFLEQQTE